MTEKLITGGILALMLGGGLWFYWKPSSAIRTHEDTLARCYIYGSHISCVRFYDPQRTDPPAVIRIDSQGNVHKESE